MRILPVVSSCWSRGATTLGYRASYEYVSMSDNSTLRPPGDITNARINGKSDVGTEIIDTG